MPQARRSEDHLEQRNESSDLRRVGRFSKVRWKRAACQRRVCTQLRGEEEHISSHKEHCWFYFHPRRRRTCLLLVVDRPSIYVSTPINGSLIIDVSCELLRSKNWRCGCVCLARLISCLMNRRMNSIKKCSCPGNTLSLLLIDERSGLLSSLGLSQNSLNDEWMVGPRLWRDSSYCLPPSLVHLSLSINDRPPLGGERVLPNLFDEILGNFVCFFK